MKKYLVMLGVLGMCAMAHAEAPPYFAAVKAETIRLRNLEFFDKEMKRWAAGEIKSGKNGGFSWDWYPKGQSETSWQDKLSINSSYMDPKVLSQHTARDSVEVIIGSLKDKGECRIIDASDTDVTIEILCPAQSKLQPTMYYLSRIVHDKDSIKWVIYSKKGGRPDEAAVAKWVKGIKSLDVTLSAPSKKVAMCPIVF